MVWEVMDLAMVVLVDMVLVLMVGMLVKED